MNSNLKKETLFYGLSKYSTVFVTLIITSVLSRILSPEEYGIVTLVSVFTAFFSVISDLGLGTAVIQKQNLTQSEIDDLFSFSVWFSISLAAIFALLGIPVSSFYEDTVYRIICPLLSISVLLNAMNAIPNALLMKSKRFRLVGKRLLFVSLSTGFIAIVLALAGFSYYSLIFQSILQSLFIFLWNYLCTKPKFHLTFQTESIRKVKNYSVYQIAYSFINYFARNFDNLIIGKSLGGISLAYYDKGYKLMMYPVQNLTYVINPLLHPILSEHQNNQSFIYDSYIKLVRVLSLLGLYISAVCFWSSQEIILFFFGIQWQISVPVFQILSLSVWPQLVVTSAGAIYQSTGNTKLMFRSGLVHFSITIVMILCGVLTGNLNTVACFVTVSLYLRFFIDYYFLIARNFRYSYAGFLKTFAKDVFIAAMMIAAITVLSPVVGTGGFLHLIIKAVIMLAVFAAGVVITGQHRFILALFKKRAST